MSDRLFLLLHGGGIGPWSWGRHAALLDSAEVLAPVLPGHVGSADPLFDMSTALKQVIAAVERAGRPAVVGGLSLGGQLGLLLTAERPDLVTRLVVSGANVRGIPGIGLIGPGLRLVSAARRLPGLQSATARAMGVPPQERALMASESAAMSTAGLAAVYGESSAFRVPEGLAAFDRPALIMTGTKEPGFMQRSADDVVAALPRATRARVAGGHTWPLAMPEVFAACLRSEALPPELLAG